MKKILIIILGVVVLGVGAFFLFFNKPKEEPEVILYNYAIKDAFITNLKESQKLFKSSVILVVTEDNMEEYFDENIYVIRDTILMIMRNLTDSDVISMDIQDRLRGEISSSLNSKLGIDNIVSVYFGDFVMQ